MQLKNAGSFATFWSEPRLLRESPPENPSAKTDEKEPYLNSAASYLTLQMLTGLERPGEDQNWRWFSSSREIAWKTGTSYGNRDAWAVGCTPDYLVGVWAGNATGEGRPALVGAQTAGPVLLDVFSKLPKKESRFPTPYGEMEEITFCAKSGLRNLPHCPETDTFLTHKNAAKVPACKYHKVFTTNEYETLRYYQNCAPGVALKAKSWFILPPLHEWYYKQKNPDYEPLPPMAESCTGGEPENAMDFVYPKPGSEIVPAVNFSGEEGKIVFDLAHRKPETKVYWHLNNRYLGETSAIHKMAAKTEKGRNVLLAIDENGNKKRVVFRVK